MVDVDGFDAGYLARVLDTNVLGRRSTRGRCRRCS
jgi:hypothetical protein